MRRVIRIDLSEAEAVATILGVSSGMPLAEPLPPEIDKMGVIQLCDKLGLRSNAELCPLANQVISKLYRALQAGDTQ